MKPTTNLPDRYATNSDTEAAVTRLELALLRTNESFTRWNMEGHNGLVHRSLHYPDIALLHGIRMRGSRTTLFELMHFFGRHDASNVQYSLKKLEADDLVRKEVEPGKKRDVNYVLTEKGRVVTQAYADLRIDVLMPLVTEINDAVDRVNQCAQVLERLLGIYEQATQTSTNRRIIGVP
jgi:predicted MarR family transcription regulator